MRFHLVAVGTRMPDWVTTGYSEYARRLHGGARLDLHEVAAASRKGRDEPDRARADEGKRLRAALPPRARRIALDVAGRRMSTARLARCMEEWNRTGAEVAFIVGGPDGLDPALRDEAEDTWSLSDLTLPHALVRVVLAEQLYRAVAILHNHPYHR